MSEAHHDLVAEFPEYKNQLHTLKTSNPHFRKLFDEYHEVTKAISRAEQRIDLLSEQEELDMRKRRLAIKDELYAMLKSAAKG